MGKNERVRIIVDLLANLWNIPLNEQARAEEWIKILENRLDTSLSPNLKLKAKEKFQGIETVTFREVLEQIMSQGGKK